MRISRRSITSLILILAVQTAFSQSDVSAKDKVMTVEQAQGALNYLQAQKLLAEGDYTQAETKLRKALELWPHFPDFLNSLGMCLAKEGKFKEAVEPARELVKVSPTASHWFNLASVLGSSGQTSESIAAYKEGLRLDPTNENASRIHGLILMMEGSIASGNVADQNSSDYLKEALPDGIVKWPSDRLPIKIYIEPESAAFQSCVKEACNDWSKASGGGVSFTFVNYKAGADITCQPPDPSTPLASLSEGGQAGISNDDRGISGVKMLLLTHDIYKGDPLSNNKLHRIALHEIGHALGLLNHSSNPGDIMFSSVPDTETIPQLSERDKNTISKLYSPGLAPDTALLKAMTLSHDGADSLSHGSPDQALAKFEEAVKIAPHFQTGRQNLGHAYKDKAWELTKAGEFKSAEEYFQKALVYNRTGYRQEVLVSTLVEYLALLQCMGKTAEQGAIKKELAGLDPNALRKFENEMAAIGEPNTGTMPDSGSRQGSSMRSSAGFSSSSTSSSANTSGARITVNGRTESVSMEASQHLENAMSLMAQGEAKVPQAIKEMKTACSLSPNSTGIRQQLVELLQFANRTDEAIAAMDEVIALEPKNAGNYVNRGNIFSQAGKFENAVESFSKAIAIDPNCAAAFQNRAGAYRMMNKDDLAQKDLETARKLGAGN